MTTDTLAASREAARIVADARALLITAGAGMGVDSGLPDFRGPEGFWRAYPAFRKLGLDFVNLANASHFLLDPALAWGFYGHRLNLYRATRPHAGFAILKRWGERMAGGCRVFTSNVDGQFQRAGFEESQVTEIHGSIHHFQCVRACGVGIFPADMIDVKVDEETVRVRGELPRCPACGALARPNILMFGDGGWDGRRTYGQQRPLERWLGIHGRQGLVVIELGAGTTIPTVRSFSQRIAHRAGGRLIRINVREPEVPDGQIGLPMGALAGLQIIDEHLPT